MSSVASIGHPSELPLAPATVEHAADPRLWSTHPVSVIDGATSYLNIRYATILGWRPLTLDLHVPAGLDGPAPVVVYAHGGSMVAGCKEMGPWAQLPAAGIAVASVDYRLAGEARYPEAIEDVLAAIRWIRAHAAEYGLDPDRIAGWGSSAGGYLMARAALADDEPVGRQVGEEAETTARLSALVVHFPPTDFSTLLDDEYEPTEESQMLACEVVSQFFGFPMTARPDVIADASLLKAVERADHVPPVHIAHGDSDHRVALVQSERLRRAVQDVGGVSTLHVVPGEDHATPVFSSPAVVEPAIEFLSAAWSEGAPGAPKPQQINPRENHGTR